MVIDEGIALIHGEIDYGVNQTSMSLLIIKMVSNLIMINMIQCILFYV